MVNARDVKNVPGRPKTDRLDAVWLAKLAERGMLRPSFVPPAWQRELRDLCRYRRTLIQERTREKQRAEKLLEDTQIKLSAVISDIFGVSGRAMLEALIAGQRDPYVLADLARGSMRGKKSVLQEALTGHFRDHHGYLLRMMCDRVDALTAQIEALTGRIEEAIAPFARQVAQLDEIPGIGKTGAQELIAEIGVDMTRFPTASHLVSWAKYAPKARQSAGKNKPGTTGKGNPWIASTLGEAGIGAARTKTFLGSRYHRLARRRGKQRALVAVGNSMLVIAWHLLSDPDARFADLGPDWHDRLAPIRRKRQLIAELERLSGKKVLLQEEEPDWVRPHRKPTAALGDAFRAYPKSGSGPSTCHDWVVGIAGGMSRSRACCGRSRSLPSPDARSTAQREPAPAAGSARGGRPAVAAGGSAL